MRLEWYFREIILVFFGICFLIFYFVIWFVIGKVRNIYIFIRFSVWFRRNLELYYEFFLFFVFGFWFICSCFGGNFSKVLIG